MNDAPIENEIHLSHNWYYKYTFSLKSGGSIQSTTLKINKSLPFNIFGTLFYLKMILAVKMTPASKDELLRI